MLFIAMNFWQHLGVQIGDPRDWIWTGFADGYWPVDPPISGIRDFNMTIFYVPVEKIWIICTLILKKTDMPDMHCYIKWDVTSVFSEGQRINFFH